MIRAGRHRLCVVGACCRYGREKQERDAESPSDRSCRYRAHTRLLREEANGARGGRSLGRVEAPGSPGHAQTTAEFYRSGLSLSNRDRVMLAATDSRRGGGGAGGG